MGASDDDRAHLGPTIVDTDAETSRTPKVSGRWSLTGYDLGDLLGRGGMGEVLVAHDQRIDREVAIKRMREDQPSAIAVTRFLREARIQARLDHPAIVPVHELGYDANQRPYFTMKRVTGVTLGDRITARGPIQPMLRALTEVCFAIDLAHSKGIIHRDLKPSNIMLGDYNEVYVLDWGVARVLHTSARRWSTSKPISTPAIPRPARCSARPATWGRNRCAATMSRRRAMSMRSARSCSKCSPASLCTRPGSARSRAR